LEGLSEADRGAFLSSSVVKNAKPAKPAKANLSPLSKSVSRFSPDSFQSIDYLASADLAYRVGAMESPDEKGQLNQLSNVIVGAALRVHNELGPAMLEAAYDACLFFELTDSGLRVERQKPLPLIYRGQQMNCGYRLDLLVNDAIIVEVKAIERLERVHSAQLLSYLRQTNLKLGLLFNFNVKWLQEGTRRVVNGFPE
jgi:GxxExxY protein